MTTTLLTPESVKSDSQSQAREQQARVRDLSIEEERLIKSINDLRRDEVDEKARIREDVATFRNDAQVEVSKLDLVISNKKREVESLEARRAEAMRPIEEIRQEAEALMDQAQKRADDVKEREDKQKEADEAHTEALEKLHDRKQLADEREAALDNRQEMVKQEEQRSKESLEGIAQRWAHFHETVAAKDTELTQREAVVSAGEQANIIKAKELDQKEADYKEKDREIASRYEALERAHIEILGNKQHD